MSIEASSGILLLVASSLALGWANSPWSASYHEFLAIPIGARVGGFVFERPLEWVVNDVLMVIFFFVVGLEIRREIHCGELSEWRRAVLPAAAALGGMLVPATLYLALISGAEARRGWGVPMATDIAFAVGILALLGRRIPPALRVLLLALAVIDDLGAIVIIAAFYSSDLQIHGLLMAVAAILVVLLFQRFGVRSKAAYLAPGVLLWAGVYIAGVHPTIAGVLIGLLTPVRAWFGQKGFVAGVREEIDHLEEEGLSHEGLVGTLRHVDLARREALSPAETLIHALHPWVAFGVMPVFALANAGVKLSVSSLGGGALQVTSSVAVALLVGKPLGVLAFCWLSLKTNLSRLPKGITGRHLLVLGVVAGIGFTMSLFIAKLAFMREELLEAAKLGVLLASGAAAAISLALGRLLLPASGDFQGALTADEAESSTEH